MGLNKPLSNMLQIEDTKYSAYKETTSGELVGLLDFMAYQPV